jgi:hypothetical protein
MGRRASQAIRDLNVLRRLDLGLPVDGLSSPHVAYLEPVVRVLVLGRPLALPEPALREGLSDLRLATGARASLEDYGRGVALVLAALANRNMLRHLF